MRFFRQSVILAALAAVIAIPAAAQAQDERIT